MACITVSGREGNIHFLRSGRLKESDEISLEKELTHSNPTPSSLQHLKKSLETPYSLRETGDSTDANQ
jgi:hypothetical protein